MQLLRAIGLTLLLCTACASSGPARTVLTGKVIKVIDADTIDVALSSGPIRVRLHAIDAPERNQPWGKQSTAALKQRVMGKQVDIEPFGQDRYDRMVGTVFLGDDDINAELVRQGNAWVYRQYSGKADATLCADEQQARLAGKGLWSQSVKDQVAPWEWRKHPKAIPYTNYSHETTRHCVASIGKK
ncbi:MAG: thermonuclease family protein [Pseudomonadota bacterium]